jgi:hypothetical protein
MTQENKNYIAWIPVIELAVLAFTTLGTTITLFLHSDGKTEEFRKEVLSLHKEMAQEMKDFHGRLITIEERNRK